MRDNFVRVKDALFFRSRTEHVAHFLSGKKVKLLDVGNLGEGEINVDVKKIVELNGGEYFGLDINRNLAEKLGFKNQYIGDLHDLSGVVPDKIFDCIHAGQIIEHSWKPGEMILECSRILKDNGYIIIITPNVFSFINVFRVYFKKKDSLGFDVPELAYNETRDNFSKLRNIDKRLLTQPQHKIFFGPAMLRQLLNMHGFKIEQIAYIDKTQNVLFRLFLKIFPQSAHYIGVVARKANFDEIFLKPGFGD
ncbi:MAG: methyltransferase domain-containing protein [Candidatus Parcubacteria bacterium]|nr:methyltransferase domain-containing protein [Candidatus Parcubacteria bacterium]